MNDDTALVQFATGGTALVDADDLPRVLTLRWYGRRNAGRTATYGFAKRGTKTIYLHRFILDAPVGVQVDHVNMDGLDNRRANLRLATAGQNHSNRVKRPGTSPFKGVWWSPYRNRWEAGITADGRRFKLGRFANELEAARAYDDAARLMHGAFARVNFPQQGEWSALRDGQTPVAGRESR